MSRLNVDRLLSALGDILSEKHGVRVEFRAVSKEEVKHEKEECESA